MDFKITTWNVNSLKVRIPHVLEFLEQEKPDALCLQELKMQTLEIDPAPFLERGYRIHAFGQKTYNGVATITKQETVLNVADTLENIPSFEDIQSRLIACTLELKDKKIRLVNGYFPNGESTESQKYPYKLAWLDALTFWLKGQLEAFPNLVLVGDFNIAPTDADVKNPEGWADSVLCVPEVRQKFQNLLDLGLSDSFRLMEQPEKTYSWWDYRMKAFQRNLGLRIDHILISDPLRKEAESVVVNKPYRAKERPSDHAPVTLTLSL